MSVILQNLKANLLPPTLSDGSAKTDVWYDEDLRLPTKEDDGTIHVPYRRNMTVIPVNSGSQLVINYEPATTIRDVVGGMSFFVGLDEQESFVTRLGKTAFDVLKYSGESAFFYELKPDAIQLLERIHGDGGRTTVRQGDIFAHGVGQNWMDFLNSQVGLSDGTKRIEHPTVFDSNGLSLFPGVNHSLTGKRFAGESARIERSRFESVAVGQGLLRARDHADRTVDPGPWLLARSRHILGLPTIQQHDEQLRRYARRWD